MINCDFKEDLFGRRITEVFKGFGRDMAQWLWHPRQADPTVEPAGERTRELRFHSKSFQESLTRAADRSALPAFTNLRRGR
jgi:hypothetical protein